MTQPVKDISLGDIYIQHVYSFSLNGTHDTFQISCTNTPMCVSKTEDTMNCKSTNHNMENKHKSLSNLPRINWTLISHFSANQIMTMETIHKHENTARDYITVKSQHVRSKMQPQVSNSTRQYCTFTMFRIRSRQLLPTA